VLPLAEVMDRFTDALPAKTLVQAHGDRILDHDVQDEAESVSLCVFCCSSHKAFPDRHFARAAHYEKPGEYADPAFLVPALPLPQADGFLSLRRHYCDVPDDLSFVFRNPCSYHVRRTEPGFGLVHPFHWIPVRGVHLHQRVHGARKIAVFECADKWSSHVFPLDLFDGKLVEKAGPVGPVNIAGHFERIPVLVDAGVKHFEHRNPGK
jgi:hypothetical protein